MESKGEFARLVLAAAEEAGPCADPLVASAAEWARDALWLGLRIRRLSPDAIIPEYQSAGAACFDLHATSGGPVFPGGQSVFGTGLAFEVPEGWALMIYSRSGMGFKHRTRLSNCVGVIDSDYRGEVMISLQCDSTSAPMMVAKGDRIAQAMLIQVPRLEFQVVGELSKSERGASGFGSTGA